MIQQGTYVRRNVLSEAAKKIAVAATVIEVSRNDFFDICGAATNREARARLNRLAPGVFADHMVINPINFDRRFYFWQDDDSELVKPCELDVPRETLPKKRT